MALTINWTCINYLQNVQSSWCLRTPSVLRAGYPTLLIWSGRSDFTRLKTSSTNEAFCFIVPELKNFPSLLMIIVPFFCAAVISSVNHADFLARLTRFSLIGACLLRIDKNSAFHVELDVFLHQPLVSNVDVFSHQSYVWICLDRVLKFDILHAESTLTRKRVHLSCWVNFWISKNHRFLTVKK